MGVARTASSPLQSSAGQRHLGLLGRAWESRVPPSNLTVAKSVRQYRPILAHRMIDCGIRIRWECKGVSAKIAFCSSWSSSSSLSSPELYVAAETVARVSSHLIERGMRPAHSTHSGIFPHGGRQSERIVGTQYALCTGGPALSFRCYTYRVHTTAGLGPGVRANLAVGP